MIQRMIRGVLLDLSGVLYEGESAVPGAREALTRLRDAGLRLAFVTNTSRRGREDIARRLQRLGFGVTDTEILTAPLAALHAVRRRGRRPYLLVHPDLMPEFRGVATEPPDAVLVGDAGEDFDYRRLNTAFRLLMDGAPLLAIARNRYFREGDQLSLDAGGFVVLLEYAAGVQAELFGKPAPGFFESALAMLGCRPGEAVMVGDDVESDVRGAVDAGLHAVLVRTGKYRPGDEDRMGAAAVSVADFAAAVPWILERAG